MSASGHAERLFSALEAEPEKTAIEFEGRSFTFGELDRLSRRYARGLAAAGVERGDRVAVLSETSPDVIVALLGHYRLGAIHVPINPRYRAGEVAHILEDSGAKALLLRAESPCAAVVQDLRPPPGALAFRIWLGAGTLAGPGDLSFERLIETSLSGPEATLAADEDTAILLYTSGTTGRSKGVALPFRAVVANTESVTRLWRFSPEDTMALALPLFHVHGLCLGVHAALLHRMPILLFERFDARRIVEAFASGGASVFQGVPTMYVKLLELLAESPEAARTLARGRLFTSGSAALASGDFTRFEELTGHRILERYGMSETLFTLSNPYEDRRPGTVGLPIPGGEVRIVDEAGKDARADEPGEILVKSDGMMTGYWGRPGDTAAAFQDGWFATGDMARRDSAGYVTIAGRKSVDFIKCGGFKISAREIEDVLRVHPRVKDVAVVGAPDRVWGERIVAAVVLQPAAGPLPSSAALLDELSAFCAQSLADYKRPREVRIVADLPRNALGKVQKHRILDDLK
jgi:acyl-CoA synthetase (AMP-forming)/AMP-acid ligase II